LATTVATSNEPQNQLSIQTWYWMFEREHDNLHQRASTSITSIILCVIIVLVLMMVMMTMTMILNPMICNDSMHRLEMEIR
jgi:ABC-type phosphate transport system permease subunit